MWRASKRRKVLELGSGVGYLALCLCALGYDVIASDIEPVLSNVLRPNIIDGLGVIRASRGSGARAETDPIQVVPLDWEGEAFEQISAVMQEEREISMIVSTDTIYHPPLVYPFFRAIASVSERMRTAPLVLLAIERRDGRMVDSALDMGRSMGIELKKVGKGRVEKAVEKAGWGWKAGIGWEGVEIWRGRWKRVGKGQVDPITLT